MNSDIQTSEEKAEGLEKEIFSMHILGKYRKFNWEGRVERFFQESKRNFFAMQDTIKEKKLEKYIIISIAFSLSIGFLSTQEVEVYASILDLMGDMTKNIK